MSQKDLCLDDPTYRQIVWTGACVRSAKLAPIR